MKKAPVEHISMWDGPQKYCNLYSLVDQGIISLLIFSLLALSYLPISHRFFKMYRHYINWFIREPYCTWDTASTSQITAFFDICLTIIDRALAQWPNLDGADFVPLPVLVKVVKRMRAEAIPEWHDVMCYLPLDMIVLMTAIRSKHLCFMEL